MQMCSPCRVYINTNIDLVLRGRAVCLHATVISLGELAEESDAHSDTHGILSLEPQGCRVNQKATDQDTFLSPNS